MGTLSRQRKRERDHITRPFNTCKILHCIQQTKVPKWLRVSRRQECSGGANTHCLKTAVWLEKRRAWPSTEKQAEKKARRKQEQQNYNLKSRPQVSSQGVLRKSTLVFCLPSQSYQWLISHLTITGSLPCHPWCCPQLTTAEQETFHTRFVWLVSGCSGFLSHFPDSCHLSCFISLFPTPLWAVRLTLPFTIHSFPSSFHSVKSFTAIHSWLSLLLSSKYNQNVTTSPHTHSLWGSSPSSLTEVDCSKTSSFMALLPLYSPSDHQ